MRIWMTLACLGLALAACGGADDDTPPQQPPPPVQQTGIGPAGGTVSGNGAQVVVPAGALAQSTAIAIAQTDAGAPPLPAGVARFGPVFAFTPHGTTFAVTVSVTVPYDPSLVPAGASPRLYKTGAAQAGWEQVSSTAGAGTVTGQVSGFSYFVVAGDPPPLERAEPVRAWEYLEFLADGLDPEKVVDQDGEPNTQTGGVVDDEHDFGPLPLSIGGDHSATGAVFSNETGTTYWVFAQGPEGSVLTPASTIGNSVSLVQRQGFKKNADDARLRLKVTRVFSEAIDSNGGDILYPECPTKLECGLTITGTVTFDVKAFHFNTFFSGRSKAELSGHQGNWNGRTYTDIKSRDPLWKDELFALERDADGNGTKQHATYQLKEPLTIEIDLSRVRKGDSFTLSVEAVAETMNRRQRESYVAAFFRDPVSIEGTTVETFGLEAVAVPFDEPPDDGPVAPECTSGTDPDAGTLQFAQATFLAPEAAQGSGKVVITRTGGTEGEASARIRTANDSALAGADYNAVDAIVYFGEGDAAPRMLQVPIVLDGIAEPDKSLTLTLTEAGGCAAIGMQSSATLTILDDDRPEPEPAPSGLDETFGTGGKASLAGFGGDESDMALQADGRIVMVGGRILDFVLARFNADGTPDTSFGTNGRVVTDIAGGFAQERARAVAVQADGKIVVVGESSLPSGDLAVALARYNADGTLDARFGTGGKVLDAGVRGRAFDVAVLSDGAIVVAGDAPANGTMDFGDFLVARYDTAGARDLSFGTGGFVVTDISSGTDLARNLVVQPDGAIVMSGDPFGTDPTRRTAVARYTTRGTLDASFGSGGKLVLAGAHVGHGLALQSDGRLVLVGSRPTQGVPNDFTHFAVMRLNPDGTADNSFGTDGVTTTSITGLTDVAHAVALQADGRIVVAGEGNRVNPNFTLARYNTDGSLDTRFGVNGRLEVDFAGFEDRAESVALQSDGKIVVGGLASSVSSGGYGLARVNP